MTLVFVETEAEGGLPITSAEAVTFARTRTEVLSHLTGIEPTAVEAVLIGELHERTTAELTELGVARIHHITGPELGAYSGASWSQVLAGVSPEAGVVLASGTPRGMELMAHLACRVGARMAANVVDADETGLSRQVLGGSAFERLLLGTELQVLTIAGHAVAVENAAEGETYEVEVLEYEAESDPEDLRTRVVRSMEAEASDTSGLTSARAVVGAGRGVGGADKFGDVLELVDHLDGALGVSRVVTSLGWRPHSEQVGQTGSRISPDVYIACGISGAIQHMAGVEGAKTLIAINTDEDSAMVQRADYAIIGDLHDVVGAVNAEIVARKG